LAAEARNIRPDLPVILITGYAGESENRQFLEHKVLRKPFTISALAKAVAAEVRLKA
jgi:CheY-like chemotaxis protein